MTQFLNYFVGGIARGAIYALIALSYVIVYRATHVLNFAQGAIMGLGGYLVYWVTGPDPAINFAPAAHIAKLPYWVGVIIAMAIAAAIGWVIEWLVVRRFRGRPVFAAIMATLGVNIFLDTAAHAAWGTSALILRSPFGVRTVGLGIENVSIRLVDLVTLILALVVTGAFFLVFNRSRVGVAMRATAYDQEAAMAQGISANFIFGLSWAIAAALAALAGILLASGADRAVDPSIPLFAFFGFTAMVFGGIDSTEGAIVGGLVIGVLEQLAAGYSPDLEEFFGFGFFSLVPYVVMLAILLVRPAGLFGHEEVRRV
jgi:branched-chain amino acid transport system permease protein